MMYRSTRRKDDRKSGPQAIVIGLAAGGGLYVPKAVPTLAPGFLAELTALPYAQRAARILSLWLPELAEQLPPMCEAAYARFDHPAVAPVVPLSGNLHMLELWHGPTLAFKDMALQLLPRLMGASLRLIGERQTILILVATSGDTGKAALEGFADVEGIRICVFYPHNGVSEVQRLQMATQTGANTRVVAVRGNFDDTQTGIKRIFSDPQCIRQLEQKGIRLSAANSINLGRLVPQIAYYISAYVDMAAAGALQMGEPMDICVPTGNFGNILAAHYARLMGLPVGKLLCASNKNNVLTDFIRTGVYDRNRPFHLTSSPSMDILISSNLERLLYELCDRSEEQVSALMEQLKTNGHYTLSPRALSALQAGFYGGWADEDEVAGEIRQAFEEDRYLCDPHTAVALKVARDYQRETGSTVPMLVTSTASPYKFGRFVLTALAGSCDADDFVCCERLAELSGQELPFAIATLRNKPVLHKTVCDVDEMWEAVGPMKA
ncbi:MAG: threonine synthase [Candidatus Excrementavichristensenella sp.]|jgi:threonine synthase